MPNVDEVKFLSSFIAAAADAEATRADNAAGDPDTMMSDRRRLLEAADAARSRAAAARAGALPHAGLPTLLLLLKEVVAARRGDEDAVAQRAFVKSYAPCLEQVLGAVLTQFKDVRLPFTPTQLAARELLNLINAAPFCVPVPEVMPQSIPRCIQEQLRYFTCHRAHVKRFGLRGPKCLHPRATPVLQLPPRPHQPDLRVSAATLAVRTRPDCLRV